MLNLNLNLKQDLKISPQLQYSNKLLQLSNLDLAHEIEKNLNENLFLKEKEKDPKSFLDSFSQEINYNFYTNRIKHKIHYPNKNLNDTLFNIPYARKSILEKLTKQLFSFQMNDMEFSIAQNIILSLDRRGYLCEDFEKWALKRNYDLRVAYKVLKVVQSLDPLGIAGRNLKEVLFLQLSPKKSSLDALAELIIKKHFDLITCKNEKIKKKFTQKYKIDLDFFQKAIHRIRSLNPIPTSNYDTETSFYKSYIIPDLKVELLENKRLKITFFDSYPKLEVDHNYWKLLNQISPQKDSYSTIKEQYDKAKLISYSVKKRKNSILELIKHLILIQKDFFLKGPLYIIPLTLEDIAAKLSLHPSTISRIVNQKYIQTDWGLFSFKIFFSKGFVEKNGKKRSALFIKIMIRDILKNHALSKEKKLNDQKIADLLKDKGISIARRTVAKYRKEISELY